MLQQENTGLILIDVQGKLARMMHESETLIKNITNLVKGAKALSLPIIWLEQYPKGLGETVPEIKSLLTDNKPIEKNTFSAFDDENIKKAIEVSGKKQWLICGIEAHICVYQTAMGFLANNYEVEVVTDCISSRAESNIKFATEKLQSKGVGLTNIEMCLYEMLKGSKHKNFKDILPLIK